MRWFLLDATTLGTEMTIPVPGGSSVAFTRGAVWVTSEFGIPRRAHRSGRGAVARASTPTN